ncbi:VCBS repeat-containing protein, partial [Salinisphaera sp. USBA-960]|nr:VCBS repeat-containing protein [Salifodinibacter halophilus]
GLPMRDYPAGYRLIASGDVDGDGKADLVWRDDSGSVVAVWTMDGARVSGGRALVIGSRWQLLGSGDFDGDSRLDLLWGDGLRMRQWRFGPK